MANGLLQKRAKTIKELSGPSVDPDAPKWSEPGEEQYKKAMKMEGEAITDIKKYGSYKKKGLGESSSKSDRALRWYTQAMKKKRVEGGHTRITGGREVKAR